MTSTKGFSKCCTKSEIFTTSLSYCWPAISTSLGMPSLLPLVLTPLFSIEIMDSMALHEEAANERLYRWTLNVLRTISSDIIEVHPQLFRAMACLQEREILFKYCLDEYVTVRRSAIVRNFIEALTRGRPSANTSAIELHSNDVIRYVGDMLAFLHQSVANEKEMIDTLLKMCDKDKLQSSGMAMVQSCVSYISRDVHGGGGLDKNTLS